MGRQLQGITGSGLATSYKYNENGLRTGKTVNGQKHEYTYLGSNVTREIIRDSQGAILWTIHYSYAGGNSPVSMNVNGTEYYFLKNAQGDVTHIVDADGTEVASYEYDAWGNHLSVTGGEIAELNPYRYRGYRYDTDTGLYYLQSRYYNPEWGRLINADVPEILTLSLPELSDKNLFAYCDNNPVTRVDDDGEIWVNLVVGGVIGAGFQYASDVGNNIKSGKRGLEALKPTSSLRDYGAAAVSGAIAAIPGGGLVGAMLTGAAANVAGDLIRGRISTGKDLIKSGTIGAVTNALGYGVAKGVSQMKISKFNNLCRAQKKGYLQEVLKTKGNMRNVNLKLARVYPEVILGSDWAIRTTVYSAFTSTAANYLGPR